MNHQFSVTWQHLRRSPFQSLAALMIMSITTFAVLAFGILSFGSQRLLEYVEKRPQVIAFFNDTVISEEQIVDLKKSLVNTGKLDKAVFLTKEKALELYRDRNKNDPLLLELVSANTLPASLEVSAKSVSDLPDLYDVLKKAENIEEISYQKDVVNTLITVVDRTRKFGLALILFLSFTSVFTVVTIIGMKIALRRKEIEVERLVGATDNYIRMPFLLEGIFYGLFSAFFSWGVVYVILIALTPSLAPFLSGLKLLPVTPVQMLQVLAGTSAYGVLVGIVGSYWAVRHYLTAQN